MMYLSKGMEVPDGAEGVFRVCRWGKIHALGPQTAELWKRGAIAPARAANGEACAIQRLEERGLLATTEERGSLAAFRLLTDCVLCPSGKRPLVLWGRERWVWIWLTQAGLRPGGTENSPCAVSAGRGGASGADRGNLLRDEYPRRHPGNGDGTFPRP